VDLNIKARASLNNGTTIPLLGLGVYQTPRGEVAEEAVATALETGYRHIDTASMYGNEESVGRAVLNCGIPREDIWITTKLWNTDHGYERSIEAFNESLERLGLDYIDLFLIHWPVRELRAESWRALEHVYNEGTCRAIGVSNYMTWHLEELLGSCEIAPSVNQVEFSPYLYQKDLLDFCRREGIQLEAYSPLTKGERLNDPALKSVASEYSRTPAQILIRWALQHNLVVIPKSADPERIKDNADVFNFNIVDEHMRLLDDLNEDLRTSWDPSEQD
jgi:diketogulonate reductase-like aldo/keto reductase